MLTYFNVSTVKFDIYFQNHLKKCINNIWICSSGEKLSIEMVYIKIYSLSKNKHNMMTLLFAYINYPAKCKKKRFKE